ncbi:MAG: anhydro-N-acetylmuramic acid kinase [Bacteroidales bacterium]|jgi:anhydro-N-acetylmuramic acid kinase|nr:anhydro-N-acetylmuramic acid kinase [Bacteroidales bacterium]
MPQKKYLVIGLMSGSSLDGIDLVATEFFREKEVWKYVIKKSRFVPYPKSWTIKLSEAYHSSAAELEKLDKAYGNFLGKEVRKFVEENHLEPDFVSSHGHTIFHRPEDAFTLQIGNGQALADACGLTVINQFRSEDVAKGGQGAPLVPIGDKLLFSEYDCCLNIGGIANLSFERDGKRLAYDICIANQALNYIAGFKGLEMDFDGALAQNGKFIPSLFEALENHAYYQRMPPKSLGREFFEIDQKPLFADYQDQAENLAHTFVQHLVMRIKTEFDKWKVSRVLVSGGGALNAYLIRQLTRQTKAEIIVADEVLLNFKEALIFAFLGVLKIRNEVNVLASVTGATSDSCSGEIWHPSLI